ncbi:SusC/RagA family TonB-linked outer membrane protein [Bacteroidia bacterium]|nr:SusC/RagA family TonB-linked outer membrane protein [Bacteroidia bacterium]GHU89092.1 SusC/RagA family TonB-linked outer membrane protein [Bacteroidia bacterium]
MKNVYTKMKKLIFGITIVIFLCTFSVQVSATPAENISVTQQKKTVSGKVVDNKGESIPGVSVVEKENPRNGTISDIDGNFSIEAGDNSTLVLRFIGFKSVEIAVSNVNGSAITMTEDLLNLDEVVVTGYTSQKKADLTGAVSVVKIDQIRSSTSGGAMRAAQGKVAGMAVTTNGSPNPWATVRIRGEGTLNNNDPLYIIDGTPTVRSVEELAYMDIESIQVLKDASSASIYGARAANGVIIITTRKGKKGTIVDFKASHTVTSSAKPYELMNTEQRGIAQYWAIKNDNPNANPNTVGIGQLYQYQDHKDANGNFVLDNVTWREWLDPNEQTMRSADTDWQKEILRTGNVQQYNVTLSTGNDNGNALFSTEYYDNQGTIKGSYFKRLNARVNTDYSLLDGRVKIGENFTVSKLRQSVNIGDGNLGNCKSLMSIVPVHTADGIGWGGPIGGMSDRQNPVRLIEDNLQNYQDNLRMFGNAFVNVEVMKGLTFRSSLGVDFTGRWRRTMDLTYKSGFLSESRNKVYEEANYDVDWNNSNVLQYVFDLGQNNFDIMLGQETISHTYNYLWGSRRVFALETTDYMQLDAGEEDKDNGGNSAKFTMLSWFGKFNYNYAGRYLASLTLRRDASSVFGSNNRWATFPAFSLGWGLNKESFLKNALSRFSMLKLRYGWGQNGNSRIDEYAAYQMYQALYDQNGINDWNWGTAYDFTGQGGQLPSGYHRTQRANPNLKWETTSQHNFGLDFGIFDSKLSGSFDYYLKYTRDILMKPGTVATVGEGGMMWLNGADIDNKGFELTLNYNDKFGPVGFEINGVFSHNQQTVVHVPEDVINNFAGNGKDQNILGRPRASLYGYVADGLFQSQQEVEAHAQQVGAAPGRIRYKDLNSDGKINDEDRTWIGVQNPDLEYGITIGMNWKNFDLNVFLNGVLGKDLNVGGWKTWTDIYALGTVGENYGTRLLDAWTPTHTNTTIPALSVNNYNDEGRFSTYYIESGSYMKIRNVELGYTIPDSFAEKLKIRRARLSLRADNVLKVMKTWGNNTYTGLDPETPGNSYPLPLSITFGLNITF